MSLVVPTTVVGNIVSDPELRYTPAQKAVAEFRIAENLKSYNQDSKQWETTATNFYRVQAWGEQAKNIAASLLKGMEVVVIGKFQANEYEAKDGTTRTSLNITVNYGSGIVAPTINAFQEVEVTRKQRDGNSTGSSQSNQNWNQQPAQTGGHNWASTPVPTGNEPPF